MRITITSAPAVKRMPNAEEFLGTTERALGSAPADQPASL